MKASAALLATILGLAAIGLTTRSSTEDAPQEPAPSPSTVEAGLWALLSPPAAAPRMDEAVVARRIARLGKEVVHPAIAAFLGDVDVPDPGFEVDARAIESRPRVLLLALRLLPRDAIFKEVDRLAPPATDVSRRILLARILAGAGGRDALRRILDLVTDLDPIQWERPVLQAQVLELIARTVRDNRSLARDVAGEVRAAGIPLASILASAVADAGAWQAAPQLAAAFGRDSDLDLRLAAALSELGDKVSGTLPESALDSLRAQLDGHDPRVVCAVAAALGRMGDEASAPRLVQLLDDPEPLLRPGIPRALASLCGIELPAERKSWESWLERERSWSLERLPALEIACSGSDTALIPAAVSELSTHRLFRHRAALALVPMLGSDNPDVVRLACQVLPGFGSGAALPALRPLLQSEDAEVRTSAAKALQALTGEDPSPPARAKTSGF